MMKKILLFVACCGFIVNGFGHPNLTGFSYPKSVDLYDCYEIAFSMDSYNNPYDPEIIRVYADFTGPEGQRYSVESFYYEGYRFEKQKKYEIAIRETKGDIWKVRFTPDSPGKWTFVIHAVDRNGATKLTSYNGKAFEFQCRPKVTNNGFIRKANKRFLKRGDFANGQKQYRSFFPVGPNIAWYASADYNVYSKPYGIYDYQRYVDSLAGNANYMRVWINRFQYLSLYGPEHALKENGKLVNYFDKSINQKDAAELDEIIRYANSHGINIMLTFFSVGSFRNDSEGLEKSAKYGSQPSGWMYNPYHTVLGLEKPLEFFSDPRAKKITKNLIRYIVSRWGYATNIMCWELWNEIENVFRDNALSRKEGQALIDWHAEMSSYIRSIDPYQHLVTTSTLQSKDMGYLFETIPEHLDIVQNHFYQSIQKAKSKELTTLMLLTKSIEARNHYPDKLHFMGEYGLESKTAGVDNFSKDPKGVELHNTYWSSTFSGDMGPASFWFWLYIDKQGLYKQLKPITVFCNQLPLLSDRFTPATTGFVDDNSAFFPNNIETYYLINSQEDTLLGWCQDDAFNYQALRRLTDGVKKDRFDENDVFDPKGYVYTLNPTKRPKPSSSSNTIAIPINNQPVRTRYAVKWYNAETGLEIPSEATTATVRRKWFGGKELRFEFPASIRDVKNGKINNTYGDAVFIIHKISD